MPEAQGSRLENSIADSILEEKVRIRKIPETFGTYLSGPQVGRGT